MDFNIYYLLITVTVAFVIGCALGLRIGRLPFCFGKVRLGTLALAVAGYLATLVFLAREAEHASHGGIFPLVEATIIALPFLILVVASALAPARRQQVSVFVLAAVFSVAGTCIYYYAFEIERDEDAGLLLLVVVPVEFLV